MKREVRYKDGLPVSITLPRAEQFYKGEYTDGETKGCVSGHALYAFGVRIDWGNEREPGKHADLAEKFAAEVCAHAFKLRVTYRERTDQTQEEYVPWRVSGKEVWRVFDLHYRANPKRTKKRIAHSWRVVADRWGYDVRASEPEWRP
jgi:hypothetical protein